MKNEHDANDALGVKHLPKAGSTFHVERRHWTRRKLERKPIDWLEVTLVVVIVTCALAIVTFLAMSLHPQLGT